MKLDPKALLKERTELFDNAYNFKHNKRVPLGCNIWSWQVLDCGYKQSQALLNYDIAEKINREFHERYQFDAYTNLITRNPMRLTELLGGGNHFLDPGDEMIQSVEHGYMDPEEFHEFAKEPEKFYWEKVFPRYLTQNKPEYTLTYGTFKKAMQEWQDFTAYSQKMLDMNINEFGALMYYSRMVRLPLEHLALDLRGLRGASMDMRRKKDEILEWSDSIFDSYSNMAGFNAVSSSELNGFVADITMVWQVVSLMSPKQFETFYWPQLKRVIDNAAANHQKIFVAAQGTILRFADFLQEVPKGVMMIHPEGDDIRECREKLPNIALAGGLPTSILGISSAQECLDYARRLVDDMGDGFVLCQNQMISYRNDCKRENLLTYLDYFKTHTY